jgi:hypothetical protein
MIVTLVSLVRVLRVECSVSVLGNRIGGMKSVFGPIREEVTGNWRNMNTGAIHDSYLVSVNTFSPAPFSKFLHTLYLKCE